MANSSIFRSPRTVKAGALMSVIGGLACLIFTADCTAVIRPAQAEIYTDDVVYVESAPPHYEASPRESYGGYDVYLVGGHWYRRSGDRWQSYRTEPVELGRRRVEIERGSRHPAPAVHQAPPAHRDRR